MTPEDKKSAMQWALRALGRRMHTTHEVSAGLSKREFSSEVISSVVEKLVKVGYINDLDFARTWVTSRSVHQLHGRLRLLRDLRQKGIPDEIAESVLKESFPDEDEVVIAIKAAEKKTRTMRAAGRTTGAKSRDALYRHLRSRGFTTRAISIAMDGIKLMDSEKVHQAGCTRSVHPGVGVEPGGFTSPGGGSRPRRDRPTQNSSKKRSARLSKIEEDSS